MAPGGGLRGAACCPQSSAGRSGRGLICRSSADQTLTYYTDYIGYQFLNVGLDNFAVVLWKNFDQILYGMGSMALPKVVDMLPVKILTQVIGVAMISGIWCAGAQGHCRRVCSVWSGLDRDSAGLAFPSQ